MRRMEIIRALRYGVTLKAVDTDDLLHLLGHYSLDDETMELCGWDKEELETWLSADIAERKALRKANRLGEKL